MEQTFFSWDGHTERDLKNILLDGHGTVPARSPWAHAADLGDGLGEDLLLVILFSILIHGISSKKSVP